jgi:hypothetical protein
MYRFIFCPIEKKIEEAYPLAQEWKLPIQHGDSERTQDFNFNKNEIGIFEIPIQCGFDCENIKVYCMEPFQIQYVDDWEDISKYSFIMKPYPIKVGKNFTKIRFMSLDAHRASMNVAISWPGKYTLCAIINNLEINTVTIDVVSENGEFID